MRALRTNPLYQFDDSFSEAHWVFRKLMHGLAEQKLARDGNLTAVRSDFMSDFIHQLNDRLDTWD